MQDKHYVMAALYFEHRIPIRVIGPLFGVSGGHVWNVVKGLRHKNAKVWSELSWKEKVPFLKEAEKLVDQHKLQVHSLYYPSHIAVVQAMWWILGLRGTTISKITGDDRRTICSWAKGKKSSRITAWEDRPLDTQRVAANLAREEVRRWLSERG